MIHFIYIGILEMEITAELKERVYNCYSMVLDFDIATLKSGLDEESITVLKDDEEFMQRLKLEEAQQQIELMTSLRSLTTSENEAIKLRAILELGKMKYKAIFSASSTDTELDTKKPIKITMKGIVPANAH